MTDVAESMTAAEAQALLKRALDSLNKQEMVAADETLAKVLAERPEDADALQLLGVLRRLQGRLDEAEQCYRRALAANPNLPQAHHNLGNLLRATARNEEAAAEQREAIRLKPNYVEAHLNLGQALQATGALEAAEKAYREALRLQPNYHFAKQCLIGVLNDLKRPKEAEAMLRQTLTLGVRDPRQTAALMHNLGVTLKIQRRYDEALAYIDRAQELVPEIPHADYNRGNILQNIGRSEEAVAAYRVAIGRNPLDFFAHYDLNRLLYRLGRNDEFLRSYDEAAAFFPTAGGLPLGKANFLLQLGDNDAARENYERAAALQPNNVMPLDGLGIIFARQGDYDSAIRQHEAVLRLEPENIRGWVNYSETLLRARDAKKALEAAERAVAIDPNNQHALGMWGLALRMQDDAREEYLNDYESMVQVFELEPPQGYRDMESFNRDLNAYLDRLHTDSRECLDQTLRSGTQTFDDIFGAGHDLVERLRARIDEAVATYIARMKDDGEHPLFKRRRDAFRYSGSWSSRLRDCGFHTNHVHPKGWISSAYYIALPEAVDDAKDQQGWIKFGEPAFEAGFKEPVRRAVKPVPGTLVLFPSYMWHGTVPFHSANARTTIAFDAVPK
jgi:tetratricopeptide (TPR) repeat protein